MLHEWRNYPISTVKENRLLIYIKILLFAINTLISLITTQSVAKMYGGEIFWLRHMKLCPLCSALHTDFQNLFPHSFMWTYQFYLCPQPLPGCSGSSVRAVVQRGPGGSSPSPGNSQTSSCWDAGPHLVCTGLLVHQHTSAQRLQTHKHDWSVLL